MRGPILIFAIAAVLFASGEARAQLVTPIQVTNVREFGGATFQHIPVVYECIDFKNVYDKSIADFDFSVQFTDMNGKYVGKNSFHRKGVIAPGAQITASKNPNMDGMADCYRVEAPGYGGLMHLRYVIDRATFSDGTTWIPMAEATPAPPKRRSAHAQ